MKIILCISGKRESGKTLLASMLEQKYNFQKWSLADNLKERVMKDFGLTHSQLWGAHKEVQTLYKRTDGSYYTPRDILIRMGCFYRSIDKNFWCQQFDDRIADRIVIDDLRFLNEAEYFKTRYGAKFVRLNRSEKATGKAALDDLSETEMDTFREWDFKLEAHLNETKEQLKTFADYLMTHLHVQ